MIANKQKINLIIEESEDIQPKTNSVIAQVMNTLNSTSSGTIQKKDFKKALNTFNVENQADLDVDSIVQEVFKYHSTLDRTVIRNEMNMNQEIQNTVASEPVVNDFLKQLQSSNSGQLTKSEVTRAIKDAAKKNQVVLTAPQLDEAVE